MIQKIVVCGLGKLGAPIAATFAAAGVDVLGFDTDVSKVEAICQGRPPVEEPQLGEMIKKAWPRLRATTNPVDVRASQACIFVTPTPSLPDGSFDNSYLFRAMEMIAGEVLDQEVEDPYFFIIASTVTPGSCDKFFVPILLHFARPFHLVYKPEFIALGSVVANLLAPDFSLIGSQPEAAKEVAELYGRVVVNMAEAACMSRIEAELAKISLNCAVTMKISFANQVGMVAEKLRADPHVILEAIGRDRRIGSLYLKPGMSFAGPCFPRDNSMFQYVANRVGVLPHLAMATDKINSEVLMDIFNKVPLTGDIGILGLAYKAGTSVTDESAGMKLWDLLGKRRVKVHDPIIHSSDLEEVIACRTVIVTIDAPEYRNLEFSRNQVLIDPLRITKTARRKAKV